MLKNANQKKKTIILVGANEYMAFSLAKNLKNETESKIFIVQSGNDAFRLARKIRPELIILENMTPLTQSENISKEMEKGNEFNLVHIIILKDWTKKYIKGTC